MIGVNPITITIYSFTSHTMSINTDINPKYLNYNIWEPILNKLGYKCIIKLRGVSTFFDIICSEHLTFLHINKNCSEEYNDDIWLSKFTRIKKTYY